MIARTAFDAALGRKPHEVIQEAKRVASQIQESSDLWDLERHLTQRSKKIDRKYTIGIRSSRRCWGDFCTKSDSGQGELHGLHEDKLKPIRSFAKF